MGHNMIFVLFLLPLVAHQVTSYAVTTTGKPLECNKGQAFWCQNITTSVQCNALKHCIQGVWEKEVPIELDKSEVCQTCMDMVKQARDQLESNETQTDIKAVLEGSCKLIPIKVVREECIKLMDEFAPALVDTLASQMNPQVVCSVAGLCNNARVHRLEAEYQMEHAKPKLDCDNCFKLMHSVEYKLGEADNDDLMQSLIRMCRQVGSLSDACSAIVIKEINPIGEWIKENVKAMPVCSLSGVCKEKWHSHPLVKVKMADVAVTSVKVNDDLPCDLCKQLVKYLRDTLVSNTTQEEFKDVLQGICNQMSAYKDECNEVVSTYYPALYNFLVNELDGQMICQEITICPKASTDVLLKPLIPIESKQKEREELTTTPYPLPVERLNPLTIFPAALLPANAENNNGNAQVCAMCEYFLHFVQEELTLPSSEEKIRHYVEHLCERLPESVGAECESFAQNYLDSVIALLANEIDPSQVCPTLKVCPSSELVTVPYNDKPTCPLCLLAMQEIESKIIHTNRSKEEIIDVLDDLCRLDLFPHTLSLECVNFVNTHRRAIIDMVMATFSPQESCVFLHLCVPPQAPQPMVTSGNIDTNEISQESTEVSNPNACVLCEFVMTKISQDLKDKKTEDEIKMVVYKVCDHMPKTVVAQCKSFVDQYEDLIISLLAEELDPKQVCTALNLCDKAVSVIRSSMRKCLICEATMEALRSVLSDPDVDEDLNKNLVRACQSLPEKEARYCDSFVEQLAPQIEQALRTLPVGPIVCRRLDICDHQVEHSRRVNPANCKYGSSYWCQSTTKAAVCDAIDYCQQHVWMGDKPKKRHNKGRVVIED